MAFVSYDSQPPQAPSGSACWICLEEGADDSGGKLMRSCACRGESGFVHPSCLGGYAWRKSEEIYNNSAGAEKNDARVPWHTCPTCHQPFTGHLKLDLAKYYIEKTKPLPESDCRRLFASLILAETKATEFGDYAGGMDQYEEVLATIQSYSDRRPAEDPQTFNELAPRMEVECLEGLGMAYDDIGDSSKSVFYFENAHKLALDIYIPSHPILKMMELHLSRLRSDGDFSFRMSDLLADNRKHLGENDDSTITGMINLAQQLLSEGKLSEACDLCNEAYEAAKQSLGPMHETTKLTERQSKEYRALLDSQKVQAAIMAGEAKPAKLISPDPSLDGKTVYILRPVRTDPKKYICAMLGDDRHSIKKVKILLSKLILKQDTVVEVRDMTSSDRRLNGKRGAVQSFDDDDAGFGIKSYEVIFDDARISPREIDVENISVVLG